MLHQKSLALILCICLVQFKPNVDAFNAVICEPKLLACEGVLKICTYLIVGVAKTKSDIIYYDDSYIKAKASSSLRKGREPPHIVVFKKWKFNLGAHNIHKIVGKLAELKVKGVLLYMADHWNEMLFSLKEIYQGIFDLIKEFKAAVDKHDMILVLHFEYFGGQGYAYDGFIPGEILLYVQYADYIHIGPKFNVRQPITMDASSSFVFLESLGVPAEKMLLRFSLISPTQDASTTKTSNSDMSQALTDEKWDGKIKLPFQTAGGNILYYVDETSTKQKMKYLSLRDVGGLLLSDGDQGGSCEHKEKLVRAMKSYLRSRKYTLREIQELQKVHIAKYFFNRMRDDE